MSVTEDEPPPASQGFARRIGRVQATAINMSQMVGVGPFITIPLMVVAFGGPQAIIGWICGGILALADGLIWAELGASMPRAGGSYVYLREAFQYRTGRLMPFLFVWTAILFIPLIMSTGIVGFISYLTYLWPSMTHAQGDLVGLALCVLTIAVLWRKIDDIGRLTLVLWGVMLVSVGSLIIASFTDFHAHQAFTWPAHAVDLGASKFWISFALGLSVGVYDYLGYNTTSYMAAEIKNPGWVIPRSVIYSILAVMGIYLLMQVGTLGVVDWHRMLDSNDPASSSLGSLVLETAWGKGAAQAITVLILVTAFTSVMTGLLGGSRVPHDAAHDKVFFAAFGKLHPKHRFPTVSLLTMGVIMAAAFYLSRHAGTSWKTPPLAVLITFLTTVMVIVQSFSQVAALVVLRRRQPTLNRPYKMWLYPIPAIIALAGWAVIYVYADKYSDKYNGPGLHPIEWSLAWVALGAVAFLIWARKEKTWPFGPKDIREGFLGPSNSEPEEAVTENA
ncbi:fructoselysine transporter [Catenulispora sp. MAP12-49]|uniref:APC family permease n=1 Tax=Catenulispora sp. MAP12-49 TaxID=3156302 RepID=UPI0035167988